MLKTIFTVSGKPGLFKMVSQGKNMTIVESLIDKKRIPTYSKDKVIPLGEIAIYTTHTETPLHQVLESIKTKEEGKAVAAEMLREATPDHLRTYMAEVLPDFDRDRVYPSDIKRILSWYNILREAGITHFAPENEASDEAKKEEPAKDDVKKTTRTTKTTSAKDMSAPKGTAKAKQPVAKTTQRTRQK